MPARQIHVSGQSESAPQLTPAAGAGPGALCLLSLQAGRHRTRKQIQPRGARPHPIDHDSSARGRRRPQDSAGSVQVLPFAAGFSTRIVVELVEGTIRKLVGSQPPLRTVPLTQVQGITPKVAERLDEEGIVDTAGPSRASPFRLMRHTPYDPAQIVRWIDEAVLITDLPQSRGAHGQG